jgi:hypothetical protein
VNKIIILIAFIFCSLTSAAQIMPWQIQNDPDGVNRILMTDSIGEYIRVSVDSIAVVGADTSGTYHISIDSDLDSANELNTNFQLIGNDLIITDGGGAKSVSLNTYTNTDDQTINISSDVLYIEDGNFVDLAPYLDNTDNQDTTNIDGLLEFVQQYGVGAPYVITKDHVIETNGTQITDTIQALIDGDAVLIKTKIKKDSLILPTDFVYSGLQETIYLTEEGATLNMNTDQIREKYIRRPVNSVVSWVDFAKHNNGDGTSLLQSRNRSAYSTLGTYDNANTVYYYCPDGKTCVGSIYNGYTTGGGSLQNEGNLIGVGGGEIIMGCIEEKSNRTFTQNATYPNVYEMATPVAADSWYIDFSSKTLEHMVEVDSILAVKDIRGSYYDSGVTVYFHLANGLAPVIGATTSTSEPTMIIVKSSTIDLPPESSYVENITFLGSVQRLAANDSTETIINNCRILYGLQDNNNLNLFGGQSLLINTEVGYSYKDNVSYKIYSLSKPQAMEVECHIHDAGYDVAASVSDQNSTMHDGGSIIRIGNNNKGLYEKAGSQNILDIGSSYSYNIGIETSSAALFDATPTVPFCNFASGSSTKMWVDNCHYGGKIGVSGYNFFTYSTSYINFRAIELFGAITNNTNNGEYAIY